MTGLVSFLASSFWTGLLGYLSWMWAFSLAGVASLMVWLAEASLLVVGAALVLGWLAGALREAWIIQSRMLSPGA